MVSLYPNIHITTNGAEVDLLAVFDGIRTGRWREQVEHVRASETDTEKRKRKKKLPYFTVSGTFTKREEKGLQQHSGLVCIDIDHDLSMREEIGADPYTYAMFVSTGGDGLAVIVRIPTDNHNASYKALKRYYEETYGISSIDSLPDVSRPRFVSYDPEIFINAESQVFTQQLAEPEFKPASRPQVQYPAPTKPASHGQAALQTAVRKILEAPAGDKHHTRKRMSYLCGGYVATGLLSEYEAQEALEEAVRQTSPSSAWKDAFSTIRSGLKKGQEKPILPEPLEYKVYNSRKIGEPQEYVATTLATASGGNAEAIAKVVAEIYAEKEEVIEAFWSVTYEEKKDKHNLFLSLEMYTKFLEAAGFRKYRQGKACSVVRVTNNIVQEVTRDQVKSFVMGYLTELPFAFDNIFRPHLINEIMTQRRNFFDEGMMEFLVELPDNFVRDTKHSAFFFFQNCFVEVTKAGPEVKEYHDLHGYIWEQQVLPREFNLIAQDEISEGDFSQFLYNISGGDDKRMLMLMTAMGYLLHGYKSPSNPRIIILVDEAVSEDPQGGTGKGLVFQALGHMLPVEPLDGKLFDFRDKFAFQGVTDATRLVVFEDWDGKRLPFDKLFNMATTMLKINRLYQGQVTIPYDRAPKFGITSNDMVGGEGDSHARRKLEIEIAPHYSKDYKPSDEFGHDFFTDWTLTQWGYFDNLMIECCRAFLSHGLQEAKPINLNRRKLLQVTNADFVEFCDSLETGKQYYKHELWADFRAAHSLSESDFKLDKFSKWLNHYIRYEKLKTEQGQTREAGPYAGKRWIEIIKRNND
ncbi:BT4734/BF3469 family protein [Pontibacter mangrovi]|uniref:BT4734-like N-terminal domain-containing protein n=1 Tax=Pontibacter mangrovi TaxID=2589816 RepID=A0A501WCK2_9BACT|nr:BT4734/BF3469 family protein [Pontibacter mangrovi]TPE44951.1 hypothetical protein FJM65_08015 [Pontibacter mangrovi]